MPLFLSKSQSLGWPWTPPCPICLFALIVSISLSSLNAQQTAAPPQENSLAKVERFPEATRYQPTVIPDRIVLTLNADPRTSAAITWRTSTAVRRGLLEYAIADDGPYFSERSRQLTATTNPMTPAVNEAHAHTVSLTELQPGTVYSYRVGDGENWSEWIQFRTAAEHPEPFSFIYFGDAQNSLRSLWSRVIREAYRDAPRAAFLLHAGDLVDNAEADPEWGEWFEAGGFINRMIPNLAVPGNHEIAKAADGARRTSLHWRPQFEFPLNGPPGLEETCYTLTYHNLRLIALNSNEQLDVQAKWLEIVLALNECEWVICTFHHPVFSTGQGRDNETLRRLWKPIFDKYQVDLVLQGHDHTYGRTGLQVPTVEDWKTAIEEQRKLDPKGERNLPFGVQKLDQESGTVYVVSVSGPKMYNNSRPPFMPRIAEDTQLYQVIQIDGPRLRFEARTATGKLYDAFELRKAGSGPNQLMELPVEMPARLRPAKPSADK
ncbi:MAG: fibronectin type III domain-containing protein [Planctomycetota bacterium]